MDDDLMESMQVLLAISHRICSNYITSNQQVDGNPVEKIKLNIYGNLFKIVEMCTDFDRKKIHKLWL